MSNQNKQIELQIVGNNGSNTRREPVGGSVGEWSQKITAMGCVATISILLIGASVGLAAFALWWLYHSGDPNTECLANFEGIAFSYISWLRVLAITFLSGMAVGLLLVTLHGLVGTVCTSKMATIFGILFFLFQLGWYIVGSILYWRTVPTNCDNGGFIQTGALVLFIFETVILFCLSCGRKAAESAL
jgi:hypothetical protein